MARKLIGKIRTYLVLSQIEADYLIALEKRFVDQSPVSLPVGSKQVRELVGPQDRERFLLDLWRGTIRLTKATLQTRAHTAVILVRLDLDPSPHTNPDGEKILGPHIHVYREGFEDKWAEPIDPTPFSDPESLSRSFEDFCTYCSVSSRPPFQASLV